MTAVGGPFYEDLTVGRRFADAPAVTFTDGLAAAHTAIVGGRFALSRDRELAVRVAGRPLAAPALAWDVAIGQSTISGSTTDGIDVENSAHVFTFGTNQWVDNFSNVGQPSSATPQ